MSNLIDATLKAEIIQAQKDIFDSFKREEKVRFYKVSTESITILDPNFNADLQEYDALNTTLTENYQDFYCRVIFPKRESTFYTSIPNTPVPVKAEQDFAEVRIQFESDAHEFCKDAIRFTFQGENYQKLGSIRKIGILDTFVLFQLDLKKVN